MLSYCLKCRNYTKSKKRKVEKIKDGRFCAVGGSKKQRFFKEKETVGFLTGLLGAILHFAEIPKLGIKVQNE